MNRSVWARLKQSLTAAEQWYRRTPERALNEAYEAAQAIKRLEDRYSDGTTIDLYAQGEGAVSTYLQTQISRHLKTIRMRLTEYRFCSPIVETEPKPPSNSPRSSQDPNAQRKVSAADSNSSTAEYTLSNDPYITVSASTVDLSQEILGKLQFVDSVLTRYEPWRLPPQAARPSRNADLLQSNLSANSQTSPPPLQSVQESFSSAGSSPQPSKATGGRFIPRSIFKTVDRFRREIDPNPQTEEEMVRDFRTARTRTRSATRFLLLLIILPLLTQQISKAVVVGPIVDRFRGAERVEAWVNPRIEEEFLTEMVSFEEKLKFQNLFSTTLRSAEEVEIALKEKAAQLKVDLQKELKEPVKNIFADLISLAVFAILIVTGRQEISTLKTWIDEVIYGLSDSAKAFIIILFTDVFVGFHSPHGWEVLMESTFVHFGLPPNQSVINMFIATFPVMLDTVFKYWIFKYLNQLSPSAVATYKNMNE
ncbi:proton extrusion protein PcxA [Altericista sp. CCNU0014]|uniref:proton extrusion protein PcxA n=1 Tax=Altericista sp. CCNU0014 TaxID=3082949 RepID=UPI00384F0C4F